MRAMAVESYGSPLRAIELAEPRVRPGYALLEVLTCGVCFSDVKTSRGLMPFSGRLELPHVPGHEIYARVLESDPPDVAPGTPVVVYHLAPCRVCAPCRAGREQLCRDPRGWTGFMTPGGFQEKVLAPLDRLTVVPPSIRPELAAPLTCAIGTAYRAVVNRGHVAAGNSVVIIGLGGVGIHALQVAHAAGADVTGLDVSAHAVKAATGLGLTALQADEPANEERILATWPGGVDVVIDTVGHTETVRQASRLVRAGGRIVEVGYGVGSDFVLASPRFVLEEVELVGTRYVAMNELTAAIRLVETGRITPVVDRVLPLASVNDALDALEHGDVTGRIVVDVAGIC